METLLSGYITIIKSSGADGTRLPLFRGASPIVFGRAINCDVRIQLPTVSRRHCELVVDRSRAIVLHSSKATTVRGEPVGAGVARTLEDGDVFELCGRSFRCEKVPPPPEDGMVARGRNDDDTDGEATTEELTGEVVRSALTPSLLEAIHSRRKPSLAPSDAPKPKRKPPPPPPRRQAPQKQAAPPEAEAPLARQDEEAAEAVQPARRKSLRKSAPRKQVAPPEVEAPLAQQDEEAAQPARRKSLRKSVQSRPSPSAEDHPKKSVDENNNTNNSASAAPARSSAVKRKPPPPPRSAKRKPPPPPPRRTAVEAEGEPPSADVQEEEEEALEDPSAPAPRSARRPPPPRRIGLADDLRGRLAMRRAQLAGSPASTVDDYAPAARRSPITQAANFSATKRALASKLKVAEPLVSSNDTAQKKKKKKNTATVRFSSPPPEKDAPAAEPPADVEPHVEEEKKGPSGLTFATLLRSKLEKTRRRSLTRQEIQERATASFSSVLRTRLEQKSRRSSQMTRASSGSDESQKQQALLDDDNELKRKMPSPMRFALEGRRQTISPLASTAPPFRQVTFAPLLSNAPNVPAVASATTTPRPARPLQRRRATPVVAWNHAADDDDDDDDDDAEEEEDEAEEDAVIAQSAAKMVRFALAGSPWAARRPTTATVSVKKAPPRAPTPFRRAAAPGDDEEEEDPEMETVELRKVPAALRESIVAFRRHGVVSAAVLAVAKKSVKFDLLPPASVSKVRRRRSVQTPGPRGASPASTPALSEALNGYESDAKEEDVTMEVAKALFEEEKEEEENPAAASPASTTEEERLKRRRRESIGRLPELSEVWEWLEAVEEVAPTASVQRAVAEFHRRDSTPDLSEAWEWLRSTSTDESVDDAIRDAATRARRASIAAMPDHGTAWSLLLGDFILQHTQQQQLRRMSSSARAAAADADLQPSYDVVTLDSVLAELEASQPEADLSRVQAHAQRLVDAGIEPRLAYSCALDKNNHTRASSASAALSPPGGEARAADEDAHRESGTFEEVEDWLDVVARGDAASRDAASKVLNDEPVCLGELVDWMESWGLADADRAIVALYAAELASVSALSYAESFGIALDSFLADPEAFRDRQRAVDDDAAAHGASLAAAAPSSAEGKTALETAWASLEATEARRDRDADAETEDDAQDREDRVAEMLETGAPPQDTIHNYSPPPGRRDSRRFTETSPLLLRGTNDSTTASLPVAEPTLDQNNNINNNTTTTTTTEEEEEEETVLSTTTTTIEAPHSSSALGRRDSRRFSVVRGALDNALSDSTFGELATTWAGLDEAASSAATTMTAATRAKIAAARRASIAALPGLEASWDWLEDIAGDNGAPRDLVDAALKAKHASFGAMPALAATWADLERSRDGTLRKSARSLRKSVGRRGSDVDLGEVLHWMTRAAEANDDDAEDDDDDDDDDDAQDTEDVVLAAATALPPSPRLEEETPAALDDEGEQVVVPPKAAEPSSAMAVDLPWVIVVDDKTPSSEATPDEDKVHAQPATLDNVDVGQPVVEDKAVNKNIPEQPSPVPLAPASSEGEAPAAEPIVEKAPPVATAPALFLAPEEGAPAAEPLVVEEAPPPVEAAIAPLEDKENTPAPAKKAADEAAVEDVARPASSASSAKKKKRPAPKSAVVWMSRKVVGCESLRGPVRRAERPPTPVPEPTPTSAREEREDDFDEDAERKAAKRLKVADLRAALEALGAETHGLKNDLVNRLVECKQRNQKRPREEEEEEEADSSEPAAAAPGADDGGDEDEGVVVIPPRAERPAADAFFDQEAVTRAAKKLKVAELRSALENAGVAAKGLKNELVERYVKVKRTTLGTLPSNTLA